MKLPDVIKSTVKEGKIGVSQGYIFAANLDNPGLMETFQSVLEAPMTNVALENKLTSYTKKKRDTNSVKAKPFAGFYQSIKNVKATVEKEKDNVQQSDLEQLLSELRALTELVESIKGARATDAAPVPTRPSKQLS